MRTYTKKCPNCGRKFVAHYKGKIYCSDSCRVMAYADRKAMGIRLREDRVQAKRERLTLQKQQEKRAEEARKAQEAFDNLPLSEKIWIREIRDNPNVDDKTKVITGVIAGLFGAK